MRDGNLFLGGVIGAIFFVAACGGVAPNAQSPTPPSSSALASASASSAASAAPSTSSAPSASSSAAPQSPPNGPAFTGEMTAITSTTMLSDLQAIGLDPKNLPALAKLEPEKLRKVMRTFTKSLGMKCGDCHNESDFSAPTSEKKIAAHMWDDYVRALAMNGGAPIYCDTCHQGRRKLLNRTDKKVLSKWMNANFVDKLQRRDKKDHGCETCHGDPFESQILAQWTK